ncbi:MAG: CCA tRNA nucleotidyltransferase [Thermoprotei archaeon]
MSADIGSVLKEVEARVTPSEELVARVMRVRDEIFRRLQPLAVDFRPELEGSVAKGTWLATDPELDVFMIFPTSASEDSMVNRVMEVGKVVFDKWEVSYAEHPYVRGWIDDVPIDLVPCYGVNSPSEMRSAVDRTPFHTRFVNQSLSQDQKRDVRILKAFFKGIGVYGAEIRVRGFSGYASEVLIYRFGSFLNLLKNAQKWKGKVNLGWDCEPDALGIPDPVDPSRNVTASVSIRSLSTFVAASGFFLRRPSLRFFWPSGEKTNVRLDQVLVLRTGRPSSIDDILWGEIWKAADSMRKQLAKEGFTVFDVGAHAGPDYVCFAFYLSSKMRATAYLMEGPPVNLIEDSIKFVDKWSSHEQTLRGPWVGDGRWLVVRALGGDAKDVLEAMLKKELKQLALGDFERQIKRGFQVGWATDAIESCDEECVRMLRSFAGLKEPWVRP